MVVYIAHGGKLFLFGEIGVVVSNVHTPLFDIFLGEVVHGDVDKRRVLIGKYTLYRFGKGIYSYDFIFVILHKNRACDVYILVLELCCYKIIKSLYFILGGLDLTDVLFCEEDRTFYPKDEVSFTTFVKGFYSKFYIMAIVIGDIVALIFFSLFIGNSDTEMACQPFDEGECPMPVGRGAGGEDTHIIGVIVVGVATLKATTTDAFLPQ